MHVGSFLHRFLCHTHNVLFDSVISYHHIPAFLSQLLQSSSWLGVQDSSSLYLHWQPCIIVAETGEELPLTSMGSAFNMLETSKLASEHKGAEELVADGEDKPAQPQFGADTRNIA